MFVFRVDVRVSCSCFVFRVSCSCFVFRVSCFVFVFVFRVRVRVVTYWCGAIRVRVVFVLYVSCSC